MSPEKAIEFQQKCLDELENSNDPSRFGSSMYYESFKKVIELARENLEGKKQTLDEFEVPEIVELEMERHGSLLAFLTEEYFEPPAMEIDDDYLFYYIDENFNKVVAYGLAKERING